MLDVPKMRRHTTQLTWLGKKTENWHCLYSYETFAELILFYVKDLLLSFQNCFPGSYENNRGDTVEGQNDYSTFEFVQLAPVSFAGHQTCRSCLAGGVSVIGRESSLVSNAGSGVGGAGAAAGGACTGIASGTIMRIRSDTTDQGTSLEV